MKKYLQLLRVKHYIKNVLIFLPLVFGGQILSKAAVPGVLGFCSFCLISSAVYVFNDIFDAEKDRQHPKKRTRPVASGAVSPKSAWLCFTLCLIFGMAISAVLFFRVHAWQAICYPMLYLVLNLAYSLRLKHIPILDIMILVSGFLLRVLYGGAITQIVVSEWLALTVMAASFYLGLGKRRNEMLRLDEDESRQVLRFYNKQFLDKFMYLCLTLAICFYSLWAALGNPNKQMVWTIPFVLMLAMKYSLDVESPESDGDPVDVILQDKFLIICGAVYAAVMLLLLYVF